MILRSRTTWVVLFIACSVVVLIILLAWLRSIRTADTITFIRGEGSAEFHAIDLVSNSGFFAVIISKARHTSNPSFRFSLAGMKRGWSSRRIHYDPEDYSLFWIYHERAHWEQRQFVVYPQSDRFNFQSQGWIIPYPVLGILPFSAGCVAMVFIRRIGKGKANTQGRQEVTGI